MKYYWFGMLIVWIYLLFMIIRILMHDKKSASLFSEIFGNDIVKDLYKTYENDKRILMPLIVGCVASIINCIVQIILIGG